MEAGFAGLLQCCCQHGSGDAVELGVQLDGRNELGGTCHLEVHVTECVFGAEDVGQGCVAGLAVNLVGNQAHGDTGDSCLQRHTCVEHGER
ncbi:hypothetical protein D3C85_1653440 [compost metagenome]